MVIMNILYGIVKSGIIMRDYNKIMVERMKRAYEKDNNKLDLGEYLPLYMLLFFIMGLIILWLIANAK